MKVRTKLIFILVFLSLLLVASLMILNKTLVTKELIDKELQNSNATFGLLVRNIQDQYSKLLSDKVVQVIDIKNELSFVSETIRYIDQHSDLTIKENMESIPIGNQLHLAIFDLNQQRVDIYDGAEWQSQEHYSFVSIKGDSLYDMFVKDSRYVSYQPFVFHDVIQKKRFFGQFFYSDNLEKVVGVLWDISVLNSSDRLGEISILERIESTLSSLQRDQEVSYFILSFNNQPLSNVDPDWLDIYRASLRNHTNREYELFTHDEHHYFIRQSNIKALEWKVVSIISENSINRFSEQLTKSVVWLFLALTVVCLIATLYILRRVFSPLEKIANASLEVVNIDFTHGNRVHIFREYVGQDEVGCLGKALYTMEVELSERISQLIETTAQKERLESEVSIAAQIQKGMLPAEQYRGDGFDLCAYLKPATDVGGDLYDYFELGGKLVVAIGDVSGKGVPAALFMSMTATLLRASLHSGLSLSDSVNALNNGLAAKNPHSMFVTLFVAVIDPSKQVMEYCSCGHNPPVLISVCGKSRYLDIVACPMAGILEDVVYQTSHYEFSRGDVLLLYTDGITEAMDENGDVLGDNNFVASLLHLNTHDPREIVDEVLDTVKRHVDQAPPSDDITLLCLSLDQ